MARISVGSIRLFTAFGIDVFVHWSWFAVAAIHLQVAVRQQTFANSYWHLVVYVSLFAIVLLHEFGHSLACRSVGGQADTIVLWPLGGVAVVRPPQRPGAMLWSLVAGPLVNLALVPVTVIAWLAMGSGGMSGDLQTYFLFMMVINLGLLAFNMLPIYPLDGGQIVQSILWIFVGRAKSLKITAGFGLACAVVIGVVAALMTVGGYGYHWLFIMALFIGWQAWNGLRMARMLAAMDAAGFDPLRR